MSVLERCDKCGATMELIDTNLWCCASCGENLDLNNVQKENPDQIFD